MLFKVQLYLKQIVRKKFEKKNFFWEENRKSKKYFCEI